MDMDMDMDMDVEEEPEMESKYSKKAMYDNVDLKPAPKPVTSEEGGVNRKGVNADNGGAKAKKNVNATPVMASSAEDKGRKAPTAKSMNSTTKPNPKSVKKSKEKGEDSGTNKKSLTS